MQDGRIIGGLAMKIHALNINQCFLNQANDYCTSTFESFGCKAQMWTPGVGDDGLLYPRTKEMTNVHKKYIWVPLPNTPRVTLQAKKIKIKKYFVAGKFEFVVCQNHEANGAATSHDLKVLERRY